jgi:predicted protein tyrosine phosphatase
MPAADWELTICGLTELGDHGGRGVTHVLSILDPDHPDPADFAGYGREHRRLTLRFHDIIDDLPGWSPPTPSHVGSCSASARTSTRTTATTGSGTSWSTATPACRARPRRWRS